MSCTQDNSYPRPLVPKSTRKQDNSYPRQLVPRTTRTQDNSYPGHFVPKSSRVRVVHNPNNADYGPQRPNLGAFLCPQISHSCGICSFSHKISTGFASVLVYMSVRVTFRGVLYIGLRGAISSHFGLQNRIGFRSLVIFSNIPHWFHNLLILHAYW